MAQQWSMEWFNKNAPFTLPTFASLTASLDGFNFKEPAMQGTPENAAQTQINPTTNERLAVENYAGYPDSRVMRIAESVNALIEETEFSEATSAELGRVLDQNAALHGRIYGLEWRLSNQRASIEEYQRRLAELERSLDRSDGAHKLTAEVAHDAATQNESDVAGLQLHLKCQADHIKGLKAKLERALHTQKILERDLEEYQQVYASLKAESFEALAEDQLPPRTLAFGYGIYTVYPAKVCETDDDTMPKWGIIIDPKIDCSPEELNGLIGKPLVLTDGDVAITFTKPEDVSRLIRTLEDLSWRMFADIASKDE